MSQTLERIRNCELFKGLSDADVERIIAAGRAMEVSSGDVVVREGETGDRMFLIVEGRYQVSVDDTDGHERVLNFIGGGSHFGELSMLLGAARSATITAVMDGRLLEIRRGDFDKLIESVPLFAVNLSRSLGRWLQRQMSGRKPREAQRVVAFVRASEGDCSLARRVAEALSSRRAPVHVISDRRDAWREESAESILALPQEPEQAAAAVGGLFGRVEEGDRVLVDVRLSAATPQLLMQCERIWWLVDPGGQKTALARLRELIRGEVRLAARTQLIWRIPLSEKLPPVVEHDIPTPHEDLRIAYLDSERQRYRPADVARLCNVIKGFHVALALGGGGARGLCHIGVLRALDEAGVYFDRIAGTSAGAIMSALHAAGYSPDQMLELFDEEMSPPWWARWVPNGRRLHLLAVFRLGWAERSFRTYLYEYQFEQLLLPIHTVTVDLIAGQTVTREHGDVVKAISESINLPGLARPILENGRALVDGGVLQNVPARVLRERGADVVVAVDIGARLAKKFAGSTSSTSAANMKRPGWMETMLRVVDVQQHSLASLHKAESDLLIAPDTSEFLFDDFTKGRELSEVGQQEVEKAIPRIRQLFASLEEAT